VRVEKNETQEYYREVKKNRSVKISNKTIRKDKKDGEPSPN